MMQFPNLTLMICTSGWAWQTGSIWFFWWPWTSWPRWTTWIDWTCWRDRTGGKKHIHENMTKSEPNKAKLDWIHLTQK